MTNFRARKLLRDVQYRRYMVIVFLAGTASSSGIPLLPLFLNADLGLELTEVGVVVAAGITGSIAGIVIGRFSDRLPSRKFLIGFMALWLGLGWLLMSIVQSYWQAILVSALFTSAASILTSETFASLQRTINLRGHTQRNLITSSVRAGFSLGYIFGPVMGTLIATAVGFRAAFLATGGLYAVVVLYVKQLPSGPAGPSASSAASSKTVRHGNLALMLFCVGICLVMLGDHLKTTYVPIYIVEVLSGPPIASGALFATCAALELIAFPLVGRLGDRYGAYRILALTLILAVVNYAILATSTTIVAVWLAQLMHVAVIASIYGLGPTYAQDLAGSRPGTANGMFFAGLNTAKSTSGFIGAATIGLMGLPGLFWLPMMLCAACLCGLIVLTRSIKNGPSTSIDHATPQLAFGRTTNSKADLS